MPDPMAKADFLCFVLGCAPPSRKKEVLSMLVATLTLMV